MFYRRRLRVRLDAKTQGEILSNWKKIFHSKFRSDHAACFSELYMAGKNFVKHDPSGPVHFAEHRAAYLHATLDKLYKNCLRVRLNKYEQQFVCHVSSEPLPIRRANKAALRATVASYITIGFKHMNGNLVDNCIDGEIF